MQVSNVALARMKQSVLLLCVVFMVTACATRMNNVHRITLDEHINYVLQPIPENLLNTGIQALFTVKQLKAKQKDKENQFLIQVEMTRSHLLISGMTLEGLSLFTLDWHTELGTLNYDNKIAIEPLRILAELQLVLWPITDISEGLESGKLNVITQNHREISSVNGVVYQIKQQANTSHLVNLKQHYSIAIEELERWQLSAEK